VAFGHRRAHHRDAHPRHDRLDVGEVEVDESGNENQVRNAPDCLTQHVVGGDERVEHRGVAIDDAQQPLVGDRDHRVDGVAQHFEAYFSLA
jgi:hypothetical protein